MNTTVTDKLDEAIERAVSKLKTLDYDSNAYAEVNGAVNLACYIKGYTSRGQFDEIRNAVAKGLDLVTK